MVAEHAAGATVQAVASFGISSWLGPNDAPDALLRRADEALYVAKRTGRNRVVVWEPPASEAQGLRLLSRLPRPATLGNGTRTEAVG